MTCDRLVERTCTRGHCTRVLCTNTQGQCETCKKEDDDMRRRIQRDLNLEKERQARQVKYERDLRQIRDDHDHEMRLLNDVREQEAHKETLAEEKTKLKELQNTRKRLEAQKLVAEQVKAAASSASAATASKKPSNKVPQGEPQNAAERWDLMKHTDHTSIPAVDELMEMIGLESVKERFLAIVDQVDITNRQGVKLGEERFSCTLLGNPGTGKENASCPPAFDWRGFVGLTKRSA
jgi:hypothetical protein